MKIDLSMNKVKRWPDMIIGKATSILERLVSLFAILLMGYILFGLIMLYIPGLPILWQPPKKNPDMLLFAAAACLYVLRRK